MSGIFGIFNRNGSPVDQALVSTMLDCISYWQPDDRAAWHSGPVALGHTMLWNRPESKFEKLPRHNDHVVITMDARLDNREELRQQLALSHRPVDQVTDSFLILEAYLKWGEECPEHLLGDFCFVIWDEKEQLLFCARDHIGIKQFYYVLNKETFLFANDINGLSSFPDIPDKINDSAVAIYLSVGELWHPSMTFFESIQKLPPATTLIITAKDTQQRTYWKAENSPKIRFDTIDEYSERLRELLEDSVQKRLPSEYPIASHLSGGLDSSTIAAIAARNLSAQGRSLKAYNWVPEPSPADDPDYYEWANSRRLAELENIDHQYVEFNADSLCDILTSHDIRMNDTVDLWYEFTVRQEAQKANVRTILSGWGGDELISYRARAYYTDLFWHGKIFTALALIAKNAKKNKNSLKGFLAGCYYRLLAPLSPSWIRRWLPRINCESEDYLQCAKPWFVKFARTDPAAEQIAKTILDDQLLLFNQGHLVNRIESWASSAFKHRMEYSYPLLDRRIVEFALGLPSDMYYHEGQDRYLFRRAIRELLPEDVCKGTFKLEINRVEQLLKIEKEAVRLWLNKNETGRQDQPPSSYIHHPGLTEKIISIKTLPLNSLDDEFLRTSCIIKSILTLGLNRLI